MGPPLRFERTTLITGTVPLIRPSVRTGAPIPIPSVAARHLPLTRGVGPQGKAEGGREGGNRTGSVGSDKSGAEVEPHQQQFLQTQAPVGREKTQTATQILRAGNPLPGQRDNPRNGGLGDGRHGGGRLCRTVDCARPLAALW